MKRLITILIPILIFSSCGSGMIGLLREDKNNYLIMDNEIITVENGCEYYIEVEGYFEPEAECGVLEIQDVFYENIYVEKLCSNWSEPVVLNSYTGNISKAIHEAYLNLLCGE